MYIRHIHTYILEIHTYMHTLSFFFPSVLHAKLLSFFLWFKTPQQKITSFPIDSPAGPFNFVSFFLDSFEHTSQPCLIVC